jgi:hypothetical protein
MKRITTLFTALLFLTSISSKSQVEIKTEGGPQPTKDPTVYRGVTDNTCAVEVSFGSPGSGIDGKAFDKVTAAIDSKKLKYTSKNVGREGETRICLPLTELKGRKKTQFINQLKKIAKEGQYVSVSIR